MWGAKPPRDNDTAIIESWVTVSWFARGEPNQPWDNDTHMFNHKLRIIVSWDNDTGMIVIWVSDTRDHCF